MGLSQTGWAGQARSVIARRSVAGAVLSLRPAAVPSDDRFGLDVTGRPQRERPADQEAHTAEERHGQSDVGAEGPDDVRPGKTDQQATEDESEYAL